jgi:DNA mismatch repair protein MutS
LALSRLPQRLRSVSMSDPQKSTPMMAQWVSCKEQVGEALLLFRLGDFYEAFGDDAAKISQLLDLTLTRRQQVPMCGIPWHTSETYIDKLLSRGYSVAIADQIASTESQKGLMDRKVTRILTPATAMKGSCLEDSAHSYLATLAKADGRWGIALVDVSTASFHILEALDDHFVVQEILKLRPKELICSKETLVHENTVITQLTQELGIRCQTMPSWPFEERAATTILKNHFHVASLDGLGIADSPAVISAAGAVLVHLKDTLLVPVHHLSNLQILTTASFLRVDASSLSNLEIFETHSKSKGAKSLFDLLNQTKTPMGARLLRNWLLRPLLDKDAIQFRQQRITASIEFIRDETASATFVQELSSIRDLERLILRIQTGNTGPRDILFLAQCCSHISPIQQALSRFPQTQFIESILSLPSFDLIINQIQKTLVDEPPHRVSDGNLIREGVDSQLDELRSIQKSGQSWLLEYQTTLREELGIKTLKVGYTRAFGYYIEVSRGQAEKMPASFVRRQTLTTTERFLSQELKQYEDKVFTAEKRIEVIESSLFEQLKESVLQYANQIAIAAKHLGELDLVVTLAQLALRYNYVCPSIVLDPVIEIQAGRHPIAEQQHLQHQFVPNDLNISSYGPSLLLITGPNMAGKSTYVRQAALITIMAHIGSFVPAKQAKIGLVDQVLSRVGASDDLSRGQSTFMVEMAETASILHRATSKSLVLLDEIGRGTSTYDGISIAWAVAEHLTRHPEGNPRVLFATHYHEMTSLADQRPTIQNLTVAISERAEEIKFLYTVVPGKADKSYGIHVAKLAGLPRSIIDRAENLLIQLEKKETQRPEISQQPELFTLPPIQPPAKACYEFLKGLDLVKTTPLECFAEVMSFKKRILTDKQ